MITVIEHGTRHHRTMCTMCGCVFAYDETDVLAYRIDDKDERKLRCPECGKVKTLEEGDSNAGD